MTTNIVLDAQRLRRDMSVRAMTIGSLASLAGVSAATVRRALDGQPIQADKARKILRALLAVEPDALLSEYVA